MEKHMMHDLGYVRPEASVAAPEQNGKTKVYPTASLNDKMCPFLKGKNIGDKMTIMMEMHITGIREAEGWDDEKDANYFTMEMQKAGMMGEEKAEEYKDKK